MQTVENLHRNLLYKGQIKVVIGQDSDDPSQFLPPFEGDHDFIRVIVNPFRRGLGANLNMLLREAGTDYVLQMDDDHWLVKPLDITPHVEKLMQDDTAGAIRLMGIAGHKYAAQLDEQYWRIFWQSSELYICSNRPHLKKVSRFHGHYGYYYEGLKLGETEDGFCHQAKDRALRDIARGNPTIDVLIPVEGLSESGWQSSDQHGQAVSWQAKGF